MKFFESRHGLVTWNEEMKSVIIEWNGFAYGEEFQDILLKGADLLKQMNGSKVLMDTRHGAAIRTEEKAWLGEFFIRRAYESGLRRLALLQPNSMIAKLSLNRTVEGLGALPYLQENFTDWNEAAEWLTGPQSRLQAIS